MSGEISMIVIGLDLGTTFCSVGVFLPGSGEVEVIEDEEGRKSIPSAVSFTSTAVLAGYEAMDVADSNPQNTVYDAKRFIGKIFESDVLEQESARYPFQVGQAGARYNGRVQCAGGGPGGRDSGCVSAQ
uniref:Uncharacterized protein n=1 Tax=Xiphophorus couchianus TaxID=32473 RepID=A0A3B5KUI4_9TELE